MDVDPAFYTAYHRLVALGMLLLALLVSVALPVIMAVNRPQHGTFQIGVNNFERVLDGVSESATP
jgi:hypothetical protein